MGAILYTLTPCIGWYLIFTDIARGDVPWGIALLPWNITLQIILMPLYLYLLVGKIIPIDTATLARSVGLFLVAPFVLGYIIQKAIIKARARDYFFGPFKDALEEVKLWALVVVILSMFISQRSLNISDINKVGLLITFLIAFFFVLFVLAIVIGRSFNQSWLRRYCHNGLYHDGKELGGGDRGGCGGISRPSTGLPCHNPWSCGGTAHASVSKQGPAFITG